LSDARRLDITPHLVRFREAQSQYDSTKGGIEIPHCLVKKKKELLYRRDDNALIQISPGWCEPLSADQRVSRKRYHIASCGDERFFCVGSRRLYDAFNELLW
jgi:hypothetical protein